MRGLHLNAFDPSTATIVVLGAQRGGTSQIAGMMAALGIPMGRSLDATFEDPELLALHANGDSVGFVHAIEERNRHHPRWGFKIPDFVPSEPIRAALRNPLYCVVLRDVAACAMRIAQSEDMAFARALVATQQFYATLLDHVMAQHWPALILSHELANKKPQAVLEALRAMLDLPPIGDEVLGESKLGELKQMHHQYQEDTRRVRIIGALDAVIGDTVIGWAGDRLDATAGVGVTVFVDQQPVVQGVADQPRADLATLFAGHGNHGFALRIPPALLDGAEHEVAIVVTDADPMNTRLTPSSRRIVLHRWFGALDETDDRILSGWLMCHEATETSPGLLLTDGAVTVGPFPANLERDDLARERPGHVNHGFAIDIAAIPAILDGKPLTIHLSDGTPVGLYGTPLVIDRTASPPIRRFARLEDQP
ncbi:MAG: hypothetical protein EAZ99_19665 [Alphaproteobacteria bacterium]|nr:MAG: hypothetical protein EAZ99_19665 [Alphaproteobacteria bacterium]